MDGNDERRGKFTVGIEQSADMLIKLMDKLGINRAIIFAHSFGMSYLTILQDKYEERIAAVGMFAAFTLHMHPALQLSYNMITTGYN